MSQADEMKNNPLAVLVVGFAGSGKSTLVGSMAKNFKAPYVINLDPAVIDYPYEAHIDIRDTLSHKGVMEQYDLGPNGAIVTALNLYSTQFADVISLVEKRTDENEIGVVILDTPGQIECFTWSASGQVIAESVSSTLPTTILFVVDASRCVSSPRTFMSNMLQACSILYRMNLPLVIAFNKSDTCDTSILKQWMEDIESFLVAMDEREKSSCAVDLSRSLCLVLDEFYNNLGSVSVSAMTGDGMDDLEAALNQAKQEYLRDFLPELIRKRQQRETTTDAKN